MTSNTYRLTKSAEYSSQFTNSVQHNMRVISRGKESYVQSQVNNISIYFRNKAQVKIRIYADDKEKINLWCAMQVIAQFISSPTTHILLTLTDERMYKLVIGNFHYKGFPYMCAMLLIHRILKVTLYTRSVHSIVLNRL
jgi:hypothetical protein